MLIILSDLHFVDGTAGDHNLPLEAYQKAFRMVGIDIDRIDHSVKELRRRAITEIRVLFLGDIFDIHRSQRWFESVDGADAEVRPWGTREEIEDPGDERILRKTRGILRTMIYPPPPGQPENPTYRGLKALRKVHAASKFFRDIKTAIQAIDKSINVAFQYIPGNHDRFLHIDQEARRMVIEALALDHDDPAKPFDRLFQSIDYRVAAFHGHETDLMNFGSDIDKADAFDPRAWGSPSIGEAITIDIVVRIAHDLEKEINAIDPSLWSRLETRVQNIDNIRPVGAVFTYLKELENNNHEYRRILDAEIIKVFDDFTAKKFAFVRKWGGIIGYRHLKHLPWYSRLALWCVFLVAYRRTPLLHNLLDCIDKFTERGLDGMIMEAALGGEKNSQQRINEVFDSRFFKCCLLPLANTMAGEEPYHVVRGHTHLPEVLPVWNRSPRMLLFNTGSFRPRVLACGVPGNCTYISQDTLSFTVFYRKGEVRGSVPDEAKFQKRYEHWQGVKLDVPE